MGRRAPARHSRRRAPCRTTSPISPGRCARPACPSAPPHARGRAGRRRRGFTRREDFLPCASGGSGQPPRRAHRLCPGLPPLLARPRATFEHMMSLMLPQVRGVHEDRLAEAAEKARRRGASGRRAPDPRCPSRRPTRGRRRSRPMPPSPSPPKSVCERSTSNRCPPKRSPRPSACWRAFPCRCAPLPTRRMAPAPSGRTLDVVRTRQLALRRGGEIATLARAKPRLRWPNLVAFATFRGRWPTTAAWCCISSMPSPMARAGLGARPCLHLRHPADQRHPRLPGARRDAALKAAGSEAQDWSGGTRIGACLDVFNRDWSRRVLGQGAVVLLVTDGLDRDDTGLLERQAERLHLSCRRPHLDQPRCCAGRALPPRASGIRALLPHVDCFRAGPFHRVSRSAGSGGVGCARRRRKGPLLAGPGLIGNPLPRIGLPLRRCYGIAGRGWLI